MTNSVIDMEERARRYGKAVVIGEEEYAKRPGVPAAAMPFDLHALIADLPFGDEAVEKISYHYHRGWRRAYDKHLRTRISELPKPTGQQVVQYMIAAAEKAMSEMHDSENINRVQRRLDVMQRVLDTMNSTKQVDKIKYALAQAEIDQQFGFLPKDAAETEEEFVNGFDPNFDDGELDEAGRVV